MNRYMNVVHRFAQLNRGKVTHCRHTGMPPSRREKVVYPTEKAARRAIAAIGITMYVYQCPDSDHWHTTTNPQ